VIADGSVRAEDVERLVLCSGKVYYDIVASPARAAATRVAVGRVELLYPLPADRLRSLIAGYPNLKEVVWAQEEPHNMGARKFVVPELRKMVPAGVPVVEVSRPERASPAEGYPAAHAQEQGRIVQAVLA
jgi:2-oxoglutarate dehydrogenase complex dehydrogenase (E1) component-like enzyme